MAGTLKCPACGFEGDNFQGRVCPQCNKKLPPAISFGPWIGGLIQLIFALTFMSVFHFPRPMVIVAGGFILIGTLATSLRRKSSTPSKPRPAPVRQTPAATMFGIAIGACAFGLLGGLLFSFVTFMNSWSTYQLLQGQAYHAASFQVTRVYLQRGTSKNSSTRAFASGMVEGRKEWMDLLPYLKRTPSDQAELESLVPDGSVIPVYLFPDLKGYARIQLIGTLPPAEAHYKRAMSTLNYGLVALGIGAAILFVLNRLRRSSLEPTPA